MQLSLKMAKIEFNFFIILEKFKKIKDKENG